MNWSTILGEEAAVRAGSKVRLHFALSLADGTSVDATQEGDPLTLVIGDGTLAAGLERLLIGLRRGERRRFELAPGEAFPLPDPAHLHALARGEFPPDMPLEEGCVLAFEAPGGAELAGTVVGVDADSVEVDFNHPLSGRELVFEVTVLDVQAAPVDSPGGCP